MLINSYPKVFNLGHSAITELFEDEVVIQEKIDGSQFSFCKTADGQLHFKSHHKEVFDGDNSMFKEAVEAVKNTQDKLKVGWIYRGEYLQKPKHNVLCYNRVPQNNIIIFDINDSLENYLTPIEVDYRADELGFEYVPTFHVGKIDNFEQLKELLETESCLGGTKIEGIVIKNYYRYGRDKKVLMGKWVKEEMKEKIQKGSRSKGGKDIITEIGLSLKTKARWLKAVQHLQELGLLTNEPKDIGPLLRRVNEDIIEEEKEAIKEQVFKWAWKKIARIATAGLPEWYKEQLAKKQFEN